MLKKITQDVYPLLHPKAAVFITSINKAGKPNVMSCAWTTPVSEIPPIVLICLAKESYTAELIRKTKQFAISIPTKRLVKAIWICGNSSGRDMDKFKKAKLKYSKAKKIKVPIINDCIGHIECRLWKTIDAGECYAFFGKVVYAQADDKYFKSGLWTEKVQIPLHFGENKMAYLK